MADAEEEARISRGQAAEYGQLRVEMTQLAVSIRTLWGSLLLAYVAATGALVGLLANSGALRGPTEWATATTQGWLLWGSVVLTALPLVATYLGYLWQRHVYYLGSYLVVAHEAYWPQPGWLIRNRDAREASLRAASASLRTSFLHSAVVLLIVGLIPGLVGLLELYRLCLSPSPSLFGAALLVLVVVACFAYFALRLARSAAERTEFTQAWRREIPPPSKGS